MTCQVEAERDYYTPTIYSLTLMQKQPGYGGPSTSLICIYESL